jgi:KDO2-lipid IV(A) lauroyltransferase
MIFKLLARLPLRALYVLADLLAFFGYHLDREHRKIVCENLARAFPHYGPQEIRHTAKRFYRNLADVIVEIIKATTISEQELARRVRLVNPELIERYVERRQAVILLAAHQCNWEWLLLACSIRLPLPLDAVYKPLAVGKIDRLMFATRSRFQANPIAHDQAIVEIMRRRNALRGVAIIADQTPQRKALEKYWTRWLGHDTAFVVGPAKIAKMTRYPVLFVGMKRVRRGYYEVFFKPLAEPPYEDGVDQIMEPYTRELEQLIQDAPPDWLWSYKKWRYKKPLYAH